VSRHPLRRDKTCLNCGKTVQERYCTYCGQENLEPIESVGHLVRHFFEDVTHFDGKFFLTVKDLLLRPGYLTREYVEGRRMTYLNPIRMYIFISALFFLALFAGSREGDGGQKENAAAVTAAAAGGADTTRVAAVGRGVVARKMIVAGVDADAVKNAIAGLNARDESLSLKYGSAGVVVIDIVENKYKSLREYDSVQRALPDSARDKGLMHWITRNNVRQKIKHGGQGHMHLEVDVRHDIPKVMFFLLPLFALYVGWFYSRRKYYYVNHAIFSVHFHCFAFLLFLLLMLLNAVIPGLWAGVVLALIAVVTLFVYLVAALRGMYGQGWAISLLKGMGIALIYFFTTMVVSTLLLVTAVLRI
jgi:uncharacterized protein DUF3667